MPAMAAAALLKIIRLIRLRPRISTTEFIIRMSLSATYCRTWPEASVLTMSLGVPSGSAAHGGRADGRAGRAADAQHAGDFAPGEGLRHQPRGADGGRIDRRAAIAAGPRLG